MSTSMTPFLSRRWRESDIIPDGANRVTCFAARISVARLTTAPLQQLSRSAGKGGVACDESGLDAVVAPEFRQQSADMGFDGPFREVHEPCDACVRHALRQVHQHFLFASREQ